MTATVDSSGSAAPLALAQTTMGHGAPFSHTPDQGAPDQPLSLPQSPPGDAVGHRDIHEQLHTKLAQLTSLLTCSYGVGAEWMETIGKGHRDNILWLASDVAAEVQCLVEQLDGAVR
ncbi:MAG: hypothetical protein Q7V20_05245 [Aquabacterium sp.]|uniref:hypothetical protein n=1 Tax=Aquabacterium sp. TaxID=1872578 RepID=UPI0027253D8E|nr:hypothetical protein [Aquabacterium sp.]MDO9002840.1 hypothetical protein [Aquabacterium sp.]